jgi:hypothetical protein
MGHISILFLQNGALKAHYALEMFVCYNLVTLPPPDLAELALWVASYSEDAENWSSRSSCVRGVLQSPIVDSVSY